MKSAHTHFETRKTQLSATWDPISHRMRDGFVYYQVLVPTEVHSSTLRVTVSGTERIPTLRTVGLPSPVVPTWFIVDVGGLAEANISTTILAP